MLVFYLVFWPCLNSKQRSPLSHHFCSTLLRNLIFRFFPLFDFSPSFWFFFLDIGQEIFSLNYLDFLVFFYQFPRKFGGFSSIDALVFLYHYSLGLRSFLLTIMLIIYLYAYWSLRFQRGAIIIT